MGAGNSSWWLEIRKMVTFFVLFLIVFFICVAVIEWRVEIPPRVGGDEIAEQALTYLVNLETENPELAGKLKAEQIQKPDSLFYSVSKAMAHSMLNAAEQRIIETAARLDCRYDNYGAIRLDGIGKKDELTNAIERFVTLVREGSTPEVLQEHVLEIELDDEGGEE